MVNQTVWFCFGLTLRIQPVQGETVLVKTALS